MYTVNRLIAIIKPKQPFMDWLESTPGWDLDLSLDVCHNGDQEFS